LLADVPSKVRKKLNLPERDEGIDLIARDRRGKYWAIQAKWRTDLEQALSLRESLLRARDRYRGYVDAGGLMAYAPFKASPAQ
jgi:predicted helicase